ncbi:hypothetical protein NL676_011960 [Syzygium grande]|nr:hypothetical protein NL676_011960 [Syzygium grande]
MLAKRMRSFGMIGLWTEETQVPNMLISEETQVPSMLISEAGRAAMALLLPKLFMALSTIFGLNHLCCRLKTSKAPRVSGPFTTVLRSEAVSNEEE